MPLERVIYHPLQNAMTGVFFPSVGGGSAVDFTIPMGLLSKLHSWYDFENNINDGWGCWPLTSENIAPTYGASPSGQAMLTGNVESYATFPNWGDPAKLFGLGCFVSSSNFTDDTFNISLGNGDLVGEALSINEYSGGYDAHGRLSPTNYSASVASSVDTWHLVVAEHAVDGVIKIHYDTTINANTVAASTTLNTISTVLMGRGDGANVASKNAFAFIYQGALTFEELSYIYNGGNGRSISDIITDASYVRDTYRFDTLTGATHAISYSGKRVGRIASASGVDGTTAYMSSTRTTGKYWGAYRVTAVSTGTFANRFYIRNGSSAWHQFGASPSVGEDGTNFTLANVYTYATITDAQVGMWAADMTAGKLWFGREGVWHGNPSAGTGESFTFTPGLALNPAILLQDLKSVEFYLRATEMPYLSPTGFTPWGDA